MKLLNNHLLIRPLPRIPQLKLLNGSIISVTDLTADERKAYDQALTIEELSDNTKKIASGVVVMVPEKLNSSAIKAAIYGNDPDPNTKSYATFKDIDFTTPQVGTGDVVYFHYNTGDNIRGAGRSMIGSDFPGSSLDPAQEYWLLHYDTYLSIYAFTSHGSSDIIPFEYNMLCECIPPEPLSQILWTPEAENKNSLKAKVLHPGKCSLVMEIAAGDTIIHSKYAGIPIWIGDKEFAIVNLRDINGIIKSGQSKKPNESGT